jgi:hypothetical protein
LHGLGKFRNTKIRTFCIFRKMLTYLCKKFHLKRLFKNGAFIV